MKNKIIALLLIINIVLVGIIYNLMKPTERLEEEKQVLKEMSTSEREEELNNEIKELTTSATECATYVQSCKAQIASAITEKGVSTNEADTLDVMVENIKSINSVGYYLYTTIGLWGIVGTSGSRTADLSGYANYTTLTEENFEYLIGCGGAWNDNVTPAGSGSIRVISLTYSNTTGQLVLNYTTTQANANGEAVSGTLPIIVPVIS